MTDLTFLSPLSYSTSGQNKLNFLSAITSPSGSLNPINFLSSLNIPNAATNPILGAYATAQAVNGASGTSSPVSTNVSGSSFYVFVMFDLDATGGSSGPAVITDSQNNAYTKIWEQDNNTGSGDSFTATLWECKNGTGSSSHTWTVNPGASTQIFAFEIINQGTLSNAIVSGNVSSGSTLDSGNITTRNPSQLIGLAGWSGGSSATIPSGFSSLYNVKDSTHLGLAAANGAVVSPGMYSIDWNVSGASAGAGLIAAFQYPYPMVSLDISSLPSSISVGSDLNQQLTAINSDTTGAITISAASLPDGLVLGSTTDSNDTYTANISGTPTAAANSTGYPITATNGTQSNTQMWIVEIKSANSAVVFIGALTPVTGSTSGSQNVALPAGSAAGDTVIVSVSSDTSSFDSALSGAVTLISASWGSDVQSAGVFAKFLTASDITNGYVTVVQNTSTNNWSISGAVFRGVSSLYTDVAPTSNNSGTTVSSTYSMIAPGLTTVTPGDTLIYFGAPDVSGSSTGTFNTPTGFTKITDTVQAAADSTLSYMQKPLIGATGDVSCTYTNGTSGDWAAFLIALKPMTPATTISTSGLITGKVGAAYSATVSANLIDGATAGTISVDALPSGLTLGSTSTTGNVSSANITGIPTTDTGSSPVTSTFSDNGSAPVSSSPYTWVILPEGNGIVVMNNWFGTYANNVANATLSTGLTVDAGDVVVAACLAFDSYSPARDYQAVDVDGVLNRTAISDDERNSYGWVSWRTVTTASNNYQITTQLNPANTGGGDPRISDRQVNVFVLKGAAGTEVSSSFTANTNYAQSLNAQMDSPAGAFSLIYSTSTSTDANGQILTPNTGFTQAINSDISTMSAEGFATWYQVSTNALSQPFTVGVDSSTGYVHIAIKTFAIQ